MRNSITIWACGILTLVICSAVAADQRDGRGPEAPVDPAATLRIARISDFSQPLGSEIAEPASVGGGLTVAAPVPAMAAGTGGCTATSCSGHCGRAYCDRCGGGMRGHATKCRTPHSGCATRCPTEPLGASVYAHLHTQVVNGMVDRLVLYQHDFQDPAVGAGSRLNLHGERRLADLARMMQQQSVFPLVIQRSPENPKLDAARRAHVLAKLRGMQGGIPDDWVVVGDPAPPGLSGIEALEIYENLLRQTQQGGHTLSNMSGGGTTTAVPTAGASP